MAWRQLTRGRRAQISNNFIRCIEGLENLPMLQTLQAAHNQLRSADDVRGLLHCPALSVVDLQHNRMDDVAALDVIEAMPQLAVLQLMGNPVISSVPQYRRRTIARCKALTYLDDRPVFHEDRLATEAWAWGEEALGERRGLEAEREERARQRRAREEDHKRNLDYMRGLQEEARARVLARGGPVAAHEQVAAMADGAASGPVAPQNAAHSSDSLYAKALAAVEAKRCAAQVAARLGVALTSAGVFPPTRAQQGAASPGIYCATRGGCGGRRGGVGRLCRAGIGRQPGGRRVGPGGPRRPRLSQRAGTRINGTRAGRRHLCAGRTASA